MTSLQTVYVAPVAKGTGDGSSAANAHGMATANDKTWLINITGAWRTELLGSPTDVGLNEATTVRTVAPGLEADYGDKSYITDTRNAVFVRRICWITDQGNYQFADNVMSLKNLPPPPDNPLTAGTAGQPPIRMFHLVGYRSSDGKMTHQVPSGTTTTRSVALPVKSGDPSTWSTASNYTVKSTGPNAMNNWTGATANATKTWSVADPSPVRAVIVGTRTPDPRTAAQIAAKVQWNVGIPITVNDPDGTGIEPIVKDSAGKAVTLNPGQLWDPAAQSVTTVTTSYAVGQYAFFVAGSGLCMQGFEFRDVQAPITYGGGGTIPDHFHAYRDIVVSNAKYCVWRGDYKYDVECTRWTVMGVSQKHFSPGQYNQRWNLSDIRTTGNWCVGDQYPCLIAAADGATSAASAYYAGAFRFSRVIVENLWTGTPSGNVYVNGDGVDFEGWGIALRDFYVDLTPDGGIDTKTKSYWVNWSSTVAFNTYLSRNKRAFRSWPPAGQPSKTAPHVMRDVTIASPRQYGVYLVGLPEHHKFVDWHNPDGRANFIDVAGRPGYVAVSNENNVGGNMDVVVHQCFDPRTTGSVSSGLNANTALDPAVFRARLWTPKTPPTPLALAVNGATTDDGSPVSVAAGSSVQITFPNLPAGTVITPTVSGPSTVTQSGSTVTVTAAV